MSLGFEQHDIAPGPQPEPVCPTMVCSLCRPDRSCTGAACPICADVPPLHPHRPEFRNTAAGHIRVCARDLKPWPCPDAPNPVSGL